MIIIACAILGFSSAAGYTKELSTLKSFRSAVRYMRNELYCRCMPLPALCRSAASVGEGVVCTFWLNMAIELEAQICPDPMQCTLCALAKTKNVPTSMCDAIQKIGKTLGAFDLQGQLDGFDHVCMQLDEAIKMRSNQHDMRIRGYRTLGICAGLVLAIIMI